MNSFSFIRTKICENILRTLITKIEREQNQESTKKRLKSQTTDAPISSHRQIVLTRLLHDRIDNLRKEYVANRLNRKTALVKEQVQTQRLKQQQLILKQQQQQAAIVKQEETKPDDEPKKVDSPITPTIKKAKKSTGSESQKTKPKSPEEKKTKRY